MKIFGIDFSKKKQLQFNITEKDKEWVINCLLSLVSKYGDSYLNHSFDLTNFNSNIGVDSVFQNLLSCFKIEYIKYKIEEISLIQSTSSIPYEIEGEVFETSLVKDEDVYIIFIEKNVLKDSQYTLSKLILIAVEIYLIETAFDYGKDEEGRLFIYIASIFFGFGKEVANELYNIGRNSEDFMETQWTRIAIIPANVFAFALATYSIYFISTLTD